MPDLLSRVTTFRADFARRQAAETVEYPGAVAVRDPDFPASHEHNQLLVLGAEADVQALTRLGQQRISVLDGRLGAALAPALVTAGYQAGRELVMARSTAAQALPEAPAREVGPADLRDALLRQLRRWMPDPGQAELVRQLADRRPVRLRGADDVRFLAVPAADGEVAVWADLYLDEPAGLAQLEDLVTADDHTGRGHGNTLLSTALARAGEAGCGTLFLVADAEDWPREWYARRGFEVIGQSWGFVKR